MRTLLFSIVLFIVYSPILQARIIHVPGDSLTIQGGINGAVDGDTVMIAPGRYVEYDIDFLGKAITVMSSDPADPGVVASTIVDADSLGRVFYFGNEESASSVLTGLTITGGLTLAGGGGGIYCYNSSPTLSNNIIRENNAGWSGGGIGCYWFSSPNVSNNTIAGNRASDSGGGIWCGNYSSPIVTGNTITENSARNLGGGIYCFAFSTSAITNNTISLNSVMEGNGGAIACWASPPAIISNTISGNSAVEGGGIHCDWISNPSISNNWISENSASDVGGGIYCRDFSSPQIENNLITGNSAANHGGGVYCLHYASPVMINNTISGNTANEGGGVFCTDYSSPSITNTILWSNDAQEGPEIFIGSAPLPSEPSIDYSDVQGGLGSVAVDSGCTIHWGYSMMDADPLFRNVGIGDYHLMALACGYNEDSPCIDSGDFTISDLTLDCSHGLGLIRSDMGAYGGRGEGPVGIEEEYSETISFPKTFHLSQNYPNPFNPSTTIAFTIPGTTSERQPVDLIIYDIRGRWVRTLIDSDLEPGIQTITWDGRDDRGGIVSSGMYLYTLKTHMGIVTRKMMVLK